MKQFMAKRAKDNQTTVTEFILLGFKTFPELQTLLFVLFLAIYMVTMAGNILIAAVVIAKHHLHKPMYFFLGNLSILETCYTSTILPRILASFMSNYHGITFSGCFLQFYFFAFLAGAESYLLSAMSYDRYLAICKPLHYVTLMNSRLCVQLSFASWVTGAVASAFTTFFASQLTFCGPNEIDHFFCDYAPLLMLSCSETQQTEIVMTVLGSACTMPPLMLTLTSYVCIISTILKIPSNTGRRKAFSTCSSHLIVVTIFYGTLIIVYILPKTNTLRDLNKVFSVFYTILTPMFNPFIYSLRNREFKEALRTAINQFVSLRRTLRIHPQ
ncbi:olfactory receptor 6B1-like [Rhineura floridana]|uniref:olfactory receptor 6B1-like n=1 Tax=Rhineura floridana TaxID=261503 RepID=UPI002AC86B1A|nr:olfactory receptor 6B1-like [Rhineura floridana]